MKNGYREARVSVHQYIDGLAANLSRRLDVLPHADPEREGLPFLQHQRACNANILQVLRKRRQAASAILSCGSGKTELEINLLGASQNAKADLGWENNRRDLLVTTEIGIADGIYGRAQDFGLDVGRWFDGERQLDRPIIIATIQAAVLNNTLRELRRLLPPDSLDMYVADEADLALTQGNRITIGEL